MLELVYMEGHFAKIILDGRTVARVHAAAGVWVGGMGAPYSMMWATEVQALTWLYETTKAVATAEIARAAA